MAFMNNIRVKDRCIVGDGAHASIARSVSGVKYLTSKNFKSTGLDLSKVDYISERDFEKHFENKRSLVKPKTGDIVFGIIGSIGTPYIVRSSDNFGISSSVAILRPNRSLDCRFLYYFMTTPAFQSAVEAMKSGSAQGFLSLEMIKNLPLLDLPLQTQRNIAAILTSYDDLIENNKCRITLLENMAEEIYREWFVRFRFPGWQEAEFEKGQPIAWTHQKIAQAFDFTGGGTPSKDNDSFWRNGNVDWYTPSDITKSNSLFMASSEYQCNEEGLRRSSARLFPAYSVMMTSRATIGAIGINSKPACTNQGFITCIPNEQYPLTYLYHWLKAAKPHFEMLSGGATFPELIKSTFKRIEILSPDQGVIEKFDELVSPMFKKMETLAVQNRKLEQTKNQLLPRLISGKLSVENLDIQFPPSMQSDQSDNADEAAA